MSECCRVPISEVDISSIEIGQPVILFFDAYFEENSRVSCQIFLKAEIAAQALLTISSQCGWKTNLSGSSRE